jgi:hypothetical protein
MGNNGGDIMWVLTGTIDLCIEACGAWNKQPEGELSNIGTNCTGIVWFPAWSNGRADGLFHGMPVNCILKNNMNGIEPQENCYAAVLQS